MVVTQPKEKHKSLRVLFLPKTKLLLDVLYLYDCNGTPDRVKKGVISEVSVHHAGQGMVKQSSSQGSQETETVPAGRARTRSSLKGINTVTYTLPHLPPFTLHHLPVTHCVYQGVALLIRSYPSYDTPRSGFYS